jgi:hypothetical protein
MLMLFEQWGVDPLVSLVLVILLAALVCAFAAYLDGDTANPEALGNLRWPAT